MSALLAATLLVAWFAILMALIWASVEFDGFALALVLMGIAVWLVLTFAAVFQASKHDGESGPCVRWETRTMLVGKTVMPYRVCVERGEWVDR